MLPIATKSTTLVSLETFKQWLGIKSTLTKTISSLTSSGLVATAVCASHGYATNAFVQITGANPSGYNGSFLVTVLDANTFTYPLASTVTTPASGTPAATPDDGRYAIMADSATQEIEQYLGMIFVERQVTKTFSGDDKIAYILDAPIISIDTFTIDGEDVDADTYVVDLESGIITFTSGEFSQGIMNCIITYTKGFDVQDGAELPGDIVRASLDLGKAIHDELVSNAIAASTVSLGPSSMILKAADWPPSVKRVLKGWEGFSARP